MSVSEVRVELDKETGQYEPGELLSGWYAVGRVEDAAVKAVELSVLWYTVGKGDEDFAIHHFERFDPAASDELLVGEAKQFSARLPYSPLSYDGSILNIRWCVRLRVFFARGKNICVDYPFRLGNVPPHKPQPAPAVEAPAS